MGGLVGLDYNVLFALLDREAANDAGEWGRLLDDVRVMEAEALKAMRRNG